METNDGRAIKQVKLNPEEKSNLKDFSYSQPKVIFGFVVVAAVSIAIIIAVVVITRKRPFAVDDILQTSPNVTRTNTIRRFGPAERLFRITLDVEGEYTDDLSDKNSSVYKNKSKEIIEKMDSAFKNSSVKDIYSRTDLIGFRSGSIIVDLELYIFSFPEIVSQKPAVTITDISVSTLMEILREKNRSGMLGLTLKDVIIKEITAIEPRTIPTLIPPPNKTETPRIEGCPPGEYRCVDSSCIPETYHCDRVNDCPYHDDELTCNCTNEQYKCSSGRCIPSSYVCDGYIDCDFKDDESNCYCAASETRCVNGKCVSLKNLCDGHNDCGDLSDEVNCNCSSTSFRCFEGVCIPFTYLCDGVNNCQRGEDEANCNCSSTSFRCFEGVCIPFTYLCDGVNNCQRGEDEANCICTSNQYNCSSNKCIQNLYLCDGVNDCPDGDDEINCTCKADQYQCHGGLCISIHYKCDWRKQCPNGDDEWNCRCAVGQFRCNIGGCIDKSFVCDGDKSCPSGEDELGCFQVSDVIESINCDFENNTCGYTVSNLCEWRWTTGEQSAWPRSDHTTETDQGHFLQVNRGCVQCPKERTVTSPETFVENYGCLRFHYFLGRDKDETLTLMMHREAEMQTIVTILNKYTNLAWNTGQFSVGPGKQRFSFITANRETDSFAAIDDVEIINGSCPPLVCMDGERKCPHHDLCIAKYTFCDGEDTCPDGADEENCTTRNILRLIKLWGYPGSGRVELFREGRWRKICGYNWRREEGRVACRMLGFRGYVRVVHSQKEFANIGYVINCSGTEESLLNCSVCEPSAECLCPRKYDAAIVCSNTQCEPGTEPCAGNSAEGAVCIKKSSVCDGLDDCPGGTDELNCSICEPGYFTCKNHRCVPDSARCNGEKDCSDNSDEYECVRAGSSGNITEMAYSDIWLPICYTNDTQLGFHLCEMLGRGSYVSGDVGDIVDNGLMLGKGNQSHALIPGYTVKESGSCPAINLTCSNLECGERSKSLFSPLIQWGNFAPPGKWPWQAAIMIPSYQRAYCGGSLINSRWVVTAAHCITYVKPPQYYKVLLGAVDYWNTTSTGKMYDVIEFFVHEDYSDGRYLVNDIALLKLSEEVTMTDYIRPVCLASQQYPVGTKCFTTGWGETERRELSHRLKEVQVKILSKEVCDYYYFRITGSHESVVCITHHQMFDATCHGDSGGPLVCVNDLGRWELIGLTSFGWSCVSIYSRDVFANVFFLKHWIKSKMNSS